MTEKRRDSTAAPIPAGSAGPRPPYASPLRLLALTLAAVAAAEVLVMFLLAIAPQPPMPWLALLDGLLLTILVVPVLYVGLFRPMAEHIEARQTAEEDLRQANLKLTQDVKKRTADLQSTDELLKGEKQRRTRAETDLWKSHDFLLRVIESTPSLLLIYEADSRKCLFVNGRVFDLLGYEPDQVTLAGEEFFTKILDEEGLRTFLNCSTAATRSGESTPLDGTLQLRHANGSQRVFRVRCVVLGRRPDDTPSEMLFAAVEAGQD